MHFICNQGFRLILSRDRLINAMCLRCVLPRVDCSLVATIVPRMARTSLTDINEMNKHIGGGQHWGNTRARTSHVTDTRVLIKLE